MGILYELYCYLFQMTAITPQMPYPRPGGGVKHRQLADEAPCLPRARACTWCGQVASKAGKPEGPELRHVCKGTDLVLSPGIKLLGT